MIARAAPPIPPAPSGRRGLHARRGRRDRRDPRHHHGSARRGDGRRLPHDVRPPGAPGQRLRRAAAVDVLPAGRAERRRRRRQPPDPHRRGICKSESGQSRTTLITFRWDSDLGNGNQTVVRYIGRTPARRARSSGASARRSTSRPRPSSASPTRRSRPSPCNALIGCVEIVVAKNFGMNDGRQAWEYLKTEDGDKTPICFPRSCLLEIHGAYDYDSTRSAGSRATARTACRPASRRAVHAIGGNLRATVYWTNPPPSGASDRLLPHRRDHARASSVAVPTRRTSRRPARRSTASTTR